MISEYGEAFESSGYEACEGFEVLDNFICLEFSEFLDSLLVVVDTEGNEEEPVWSLSESFW